MKRWGIPESLSPPTVQNSYNQFRRRALVIAAAVFPREIDEVLYAHPDVAKAVPPGRPDEHYGEVIHACATLKPNMNCTAEDLVVYNELVLARDKVPNADYHRIGIPQNHRGQDRQ